MSHFGPICYPTTKERFTNWDQFLMHVTASSEQWIPAALVKFRESIRALTISSQSLARCCGTLLGHFVTGFIGIGR